MDKKYPIYKYQYRCPKCGKTIVTPLPDIADKGCNYTAEFKQEVVNIYSKEHIAYSNCAKFINEKHDLNMHRQTVYNYNDKESDDYYTQKEKIIGEKMKQDNRKLKTENKILNKEYDAYTDYSKRISEIFDQDNIKDAKRRFNILYNQIDFLPDEIAKFLRNLKKDLDATLYYIENENIPKTNNWLELFFKIVFPKRYRNRFKTTKGVKRLLRAGKIKWCENVVLKEEIKLEKKSAWTKLKEYTNEINQKK